jgi:hypothetical protein
VDLDIKPANIFVGYKNSIELDDLISMDLGSALVLDSDLETPKYITSFATSKYCS